MSKGNLIRTPYSEITSTIELLDGMGVTNLDFEALRKCPSWGREMTARVLKTDPFVWAMLEMEQAAAKAGFIENDFRRLAGNEDMFRQMLQVARGHAEVKVVEHVIDLDADPFVPNNWKVEKHDKGGSFKWDPAQVQFYLSEPQRKEKSIEGNKLRKELDGKPVFNANLLDYLLAHPNLIPEDWKQDEKGRTRYIFFWGTIYRVSGGRLIVRYLCWLDGRWYWVSHWLGSDWNVSYPAALRAS